MRLTNFVMLLVMPVALLSGGCQASFDVDGIATSATAVQRVRLSESTAFEEVETSFAPPLGWTQRPTQHQSIATHIQFRSPDQRVRMGVVKLAMPWPLSADAIIWLAKRGYRSPAGVPDMSRTLTDDAGRQWFFGQNDVWNGEAYILTKGLRGWIVYRSWTRDPLPSSDLRDQADRAVRTAVPMVEK